MSAEFLSVLCCAVGLVPKVHSIRAVLGCQCLRELVELHALPIAHAAAPGHLLLVLLQALGHIVVEHHSVCDNTRGSRPMHLLCCAVHRMLAFLQGSALFLQRLGMSDRSLESLADLQIKLHGHGQQYEVDVCAMLAGPQACC